MKQSNNLSLFIKNLKCPCLNKTDLSYANGAYFCGGAGCCHGPSGEGFRLVDGIPVIISDKHCDTVCSPDNVVSLVKTRSGLGSRIVKVLEVTSKQTQGNCSDFISEVKKLAQRPRVIVVGSGSRGSGAQELWECKDIEVVGVDVYASRTVSVVCDAHYLPFEDGCFEGVWVQAVLEHVVDPSQVVAEIHRVLKGNGIVYSEVPFMQHVHEGAYDFTRFTVLGHRYLFNRFKTIQLGPLQGAEVVLAWSIKYFFWSVARNRTAAKILGQILFFLFIPLRLIVSKKSLYDSCSGSFFMGSKMVTGKVTHKEVIRLYRGCIQ